MTCIIFLEQYLSSMIEENTKDYDCKVIKDETVLLHECLERFPELEGKTEQIQLQKMHNKYQFYLRKFQKITQEYDKFKELYQNIEKTIEESPQIMEENRSIQFINKVMEETFRNYTKLKENVDKIKSEKDKNHDEMIRLKNILMKMKGQYFQLQRKEEQFLQSKQKQNVNFKTKEHFKNMFKIRQQKKSQQKEIRIKPPELNKLSMDCSFAEKKIISELDTINSLKEEFLRAIGISQKQYYKVNERELHIKEKSNKLISKTAIPFKYKKQQKPTQDYEPENEVFQIHRIINEYQAEEEQFMKLSNEQVLAMIIKKGKVRDMLRLIEKEKRGIIETYQKTKNERNRYN